MLLIMTTTKRHGERDRGLNNSRGVDGKVEPRIEPADGPARAVGDGRLYPVPLSIPGTLMTGS